MKPTDLGIIGLQLRDQLMRKLTSRSKAIAAAEAIYVCRLLSPPDLEGKLFHIEMECYRRADRFSKRDRKAGPNGE